MRVSNILEKIDELLDHHEDQGNDEAYQALDELKEWILEES